MYDWFFVKTIGIFNWFSWCVVALFCCRVQIGFSALTTKQQMALNLLIISCQITGIVKNRYFCYCFENYVEIFSF